LGDMGHVKSCFDPFGDDVSVSAKIGAWIAPNIPWAQ
jgi:hypothetical protein